MVLDSLKNTQVNLPLVGGVSVAAIILVGVTIFFLRKRKKTIQLKF